MKNRKLGMSLLEWIAALLVTEFFLLFFGSQIFVRMPESQVRSKVSRVRHEFYTAEKMINSYRQEHGVLPPSTNNELPSFIQGNLARDPFIKKNEPNSYQYYSQGDQWALVSPGPDEDRDYKTEYIYAGFEDPMALSYISHLYDPTNGSISDGDIVLFSPDRENKP